MFLAALWLESTLLISKNVYDSLFAAQGSRGYKISLLRDLENDRTLVKTEWIQTRAGHKPASGGLNGVDYLDAVHRPDFPGQLFS